jgi:DNA-binding response OmpR family regulator
MQKQFDIVRRSRTAMTKAADLRVLRGGRDVVVMVDDDSDLRSTVALVLEDAGYEVIECVDLASAFAVLSALVPNVVLLDRELPDGSGLQLAAWMRKQWAYDEVRVVAFSGRDSSPDIEAAIGSGCDAFVAKPCRPEILLRGIRGTPPTTSTNGSVSSIVRPPTSSAGQRLSASAPAGARRG